MDIKKINEVLENFSKLYYETEELALKRGIRCITFTELHVIEAIGKETITMNELSDRLGITMGTATVAINKLTEKGFIKRVRSEQDRRKVFVSLTKKGVEALVYHNNYHRMIMKAMTENIAESELENFMKVFETILKNLQDKIEHFKTLPIPEFPEGTKVSVLEIKGTPLVIDYFAQNGVELFSNLVVGKINSKNMITLGKDDGTELAISILDARHLIAAKVEE